ncbi:MAG: hypothetical protein GXP38_06170 [Chloroflexi bacterium]|nr:hypothetical protein [Chloroflexota bacterium]
MIIIMDRGLCDADHIFCARCSTTFFSQPIDTERPCVVDVIDDGDDDILNFIILADGRTLRFHLTDADVKGLQLEGWEFLNDFDPALMRRGAAEQWRSLLQKGQTPLSPQVSQTSNE